MSLDLFIGLFIQALAAALILLKTRGRWLARAGALFVVVGVVYYGLWELIQVIFPGRNFYRTLVAQDDVDAWVLIVSVALFLFVGVYCLTLRKPMNPSFDPVLLAEWGQRHLPDWRLVLVLAVPGFWISVSGQDFGYWINNLSSYMTGFAFVIASAALIFKSGPRLVLPVLLVQALFFALIGARSLVVVNAIVLLSILTRCGVPIRWRQLMVLGSVGLVLMVLISAARAVGGRFTDRAEKADVGTRVQWLVNGLQGLADPATLKGAVADDFIYRFDGNAFNGMVYRELARGCPPAGFQSFWNNFSLMVPSFINPHKLDKNVEDLFEEDYTVVHYGLQGKIDYLVGTPGIIYSYHGAWGLWGIMMVLGWVYARVDQWLARSRTTWAFCMGLGFISTSVGMELSVMGYFGTFRSLIVFYLFILGLLLGRRVFRGKRVFHAPCPPVACETTR